jgi:RNA polymerase sigma-70 factor (ECF subfamily)
LAYCLRRVGDRAAAEDVAAETFLVAWRRLDAMPAGDELPWLLGIARHTILNERRSDRRRERLLARVMAQGMAGATESDAPAGASGAIHAALARLSERDREVLMLTTWDGLDQRRAAAVVGCSEGAFKVRLHRARKRLARALDATSSTPEENS